LLERYALGELSGPERAAVEARLRVSEQDRACLASILEDASALPPLPTVRRLPKRFPHPVAWSKRTWAALSLAAAACLIAIGDWRGAPESPAALSSRARTKGGELAIRLVSERGSFDPVHFAPGERLKVLVTCPPEMHALLRLVIFQAGQRFEPLPAARLQCGNAVPWPGAFSLDDRRSATICITSEESDHSARGAEELGPGAACAELLPE
jgi:hypothetical protein